MNETPPRTPAQPDRILAMHEQAMREMTDPKDGVSPTPVTFLIACFFFTAWGGFYIAENQGNWSGTEYREHPASLASAAPAVAQDPMVLGQEIFSACVQCHQADGRGVAGTYPPLVASEFVTGDPHRLAAILLNGINGDFTVNGAHYNGEMPSWKGYFNDEELAAVATYIRNTWGNKGAPVSKETVAAARRQFGAAAGPWTAATLAALPPPAK